jgi:hypothetical protein
MLEAARRQYLHAMGISLWLPRDELAHAAPSRLLPLVGSMHVGPDESLLAVAEAVAHHKASGLLQDNLMTAERPLSVAASVTTAGSDTASQPSGHFAPLTSVPATSVGVSVDTDTNAVTNAVTRIVSDNHVESERNAVAPTLVTEMVDLLPPRFELCFVRVGATGVWVCDGPDQVQDLQRLASRVAVVMGMSQVQADVPGFRWPFIENAREDQSAAVAEQALRAQWQYLHSQGIRYAIGLGLNAARWLPVGGADGLMLAAPVLEILSSAHHKRTLWHYLAQRTSL